MKHDLTPPEPTGDQCAAHETFLGPDGHTYLATFYPQMGGYAGKCLVDLSEAVDDDGCFNVYVWHDGEFPFGEGSVRARRKPAVLHHCCASQFIEFGQLVQAQLAAQASRPF
jgi:hypothetical protein